MLPLLQQITRNQTVWRKENDVHFVVILFDLFMVVCSGMNIAGMFHLSASIQRSVLYCLVSAVKLDRDHREV